MPIVKQNNRIFRNELKKQAIAAGVGVLVGVIAGTQSGGDKSEDAEVFGGLAYELVKLATDVFSDWTTKKTPSSARTKIRVFSCAATCRII